MRYKIIKIYIVEARNKSEAIEIMTKNQDTLQTTIVKEDDVPQGWAGGFWNQLRGKK